MSAETTDRRAVGFEYHLLCDLVQHVIQYARHCQPDSPRYARLCTLVLLLLPPYCCAGMSHNAEIGQGVMGLLFQISALAYMSALAYGSR